MKNKVLNSTRLDEVKIQRETTRIWMGCGLAIFGCILIMIGVILPPAGVIDGSVLAAVGEVFGLSGGCIGVFAMSRRDNAKIDYLYDAEVERRNVSDIEASYCRTQQFNVERYNTENQEDIEQHETETGEEV